MEKNIADEVVWIPPADKNARRELLERARDRITSARAALMDPLLFARIVLSIMILGLAALLAAMIISRL